VIVNYVASFTEPVRTRGYRLGGCFPGRKQIRAERERCVAWSREGGFFPTGHETTSSKSKTDGAQLREPVSYFEHDSSGEKSGDGADDQQMGASSAELKRGGGPGRKAHEQIDVYEERCINGDESARDAEAPGQVSLHERSAPLSRKARRFVRTSCLR
jgi:hypothetical protein